MPTFRRLMMRYENDPSGNVMMDVLIDDLRRWIARVPTGGWWGRIRTNELWPFILMADGRIDFGSDANEPLADEQRYARIDLADRILAIGETFTLRYGNETWPLTLERITDLTEI